MDISTLIVVITLAVLFFGSPVWINLHSRRNAAADDNPQPGEPAEVPERGAV
jgi:hypothetical protein